MPRRLWVSCLLNEEYLDDCSGDENDEEEGESNDGEEVGDGEEEGDDEDGDDEDGDDDEDGEGDFEELEELIELLTELCGSNAPNDLGIDPDMACGILELIEACNNGSEDACNELDYLMEDLFGDDEDDDEEDGDDEEEEDGEEEDELDEADWLELIDWLEDLCVLNDTIEVSGEVELACAALELIEACADGDEEACEEFSKMILDELEGLWDEDDEEEDDEEDGEDDDELDEEELDILVEWLEDICDSNMPNDLGIDPEVACEILGLIEACLDGNEEACEELELIWEEWEDLLDNEDEDDEEDDEEEAENECEVEFEFEQAMDEDGVPLPYNIVAYVDEPDADTYYFWSFGDGNESDEPNPTHIYDEVGNYQVCLTVTQMVGNFLECTSTYCDTLMIDMDGIVRQQLVLNILFPGQTVNAVVEQDLTMDVHPNPATDVFRIRSEAGIESAVVRTMDGHWVGHWVSNGQQTMALSCEGWPTGAYLLEVRTAEGVMRSRVLVQH